MLETGGRHLGRFDRTAGGIRALKHADTPALRTQMRRSGQPVDPRPDDQRIKAHHAGFPVFRANADIFSRPKPLFLYFIGKFVAQIVAHARECVHDNNRDCDHFGGAL